MEQWSRKNFILGMMKFDLCCYINKMFVNIIKETIVSFVRGRYLRRGLNN